jgi:hypothetical protein
LRSRIQQELAMVVTVGVAFCDRDARGGRRRLFRFVGVLFGGVNPLTVVSAPHMLHEHPMERARNLRVGAKEPQEQRQARQ